MTSNDVDSKYLLRSDQKVLDQQGRINLKELGLILEDRQTDQNTGQMVLTA